MEYLHGINPFSPFDAVHLLTETKFLTLDQGVMAKYQALFNHKTSKFYPTPIEELKRLGSLPKRNKVDLSAPEVSKNDEDYIDDIMSIDLSNDDIGDSERVWPPPSPKALNRKERRAEQKRVMEAAAAWVSESQIPDEPTEQLAFRPAIKRKHDTDDEAANSRPPPHLR
ncbi:hypothetical protein HYALB_00005723 [Hymenoscyphus albidus]|uniref:Uncharacterized protein n=1 Tax=Hymenoscyphus albidus TaxID=595503 RepID=A0A9N9LNH3_9HELO|nr:hypothetical protein HYALB_00005723 [Hymenoscyphus albidus]